jgi:hypothetical protein
MPLGVAIGGYPMLQDLQGISDADLEATSRLCLKKPINGDHKAHPKGLELLHA